MEEKLEYWSEQVEIIELVVEIYSSTQEAKVSNEKWGTISDCSNSCNIEKSS